MISIKEPACLNEIGKRENNEDSVFPPQNLATDHDKLFIVCDGLGGCDYGEVASKLTCEAFADYIMFEENFIAEKALHFIEMRFDDYISMMPQYDGMSTTLVFLYLKDNKPLIGWVGDSRIYHIRKGKIIFQTEDHSLVTDLIKKGELTISEAKTDYRKNIITRVINGTKNSTEMDIQIINDYQSNDYFLLCTDGLLENLDEDIISRFFNGKNEPYEIKEKIFRLCNGNTNDNYSMYIIQII